MDPDRWKGRRRAAVLGYWREMKLMMWDDLHASCEVMQVGEVASPVGRTRVTVRAKSRESAGAKLAGRIECRK